MANNDQETAIGKMSINCSNWSYSSFCDIEEVLHPKDIDSLWLGVNRSNRIEMVVFVLRGKQEVSNKPNGDVGKEL